MRLTLILLNIELFINGFFIDIPIQNCNKFSLWNHFCKNFEPIVCFIKTQQDFKHLVNRYNLNLHFSIRLNNKYHLSRL